MAAKNDKRKWTKIKCPFCNRRQDEETIRVWGDYIKEALNGDQRISLRKLSKQLDLPQSTITEVVEFTGIGQVKDGYVHP